MKPFIHTHKEWHQLLEIVADKRSVAVSLVDKDYWVSHVLWSLERAGFTVHFKGGTSLSKGFGIISRFSEDLDLKIEGHDLPAVSNWVRTTAGYVAEREVFFEEVSKRLVIPDMRVVEMVDKRDPYYRNTVFAVHYNSELAADLPPEIKPFVQLELGNARVTPGGARFLSSWVQEHVAEKNAELWELHEDNRAHNVSCVIPAVTLLEKIEAIARRYGRLDLPASAFVRHYEDIAAIVSSGLAEPASEWPTLLEEMLSTNDIRNWPGEDDPAFNPEKNSARWHELQDAATALHPIFWGPRTPLTECATAIRAVISSINKA